MFVPCRERDDGWGDSPRLSKVVGGHFVVCRLPCEEGNEGIPAEHVFTHAMALETLSRRGHTVAMVLVLDEPSLEPVFDANAKGQWGSGVRSALLTVSHPPTRDQVQAAQRLVRGALGEAEVNEVVVFASRLGSVAAYFVAAWLVLEEGFDVEVALGTVAPRLFDADLVDALFKLAGTEVPPGAVYPPVPSWWKLPWPSVLLPSLPAELPAGGEGEDPPSSPYPAFRATHPAVQSACAAGPGVTPVADPAVRASLLSALAARGLLVHLARPAVLTADHLAAEDAPLSATWSPVGPRVLLVLGEGGERAPVLLVDEGLNLAQVAMHFPQRGGAKGAGSPQVAGVTLLGELIVDHMPDGKPVRRVLITDMLEFAGRALVGEGALSKSALSDRLALAEKECVQPRRDDPSFDYTREPFAVRVKPLFRWALGEAGASLIKLIPGLPHAHAGVLVHTKQGKILEWTPPELAAVRLLCKDNALHVVDRNRLVVVQEGEQEQGTENIAEFTAHQGRWRLSRPRPDLSQPDSLGRYLATVKAQIAQPARKSLKHLFSLL